MFDRSLLPESLFVPFDVAPLKRAGVAMHNRELEPDVDGLLRRYAWTVPTGAADAPVPRRTFYAERYGALGRSPQGGGARVGTDFGYQVKGIGRTPLLAASQVDIAYATGDMPLGEAIREHIWGEVLHLVLPFGAVRSAMVIDSGERCRRRGTDDGDPRLKRGLLVRQCALRPAHFIRAAYHQKPARLKIPPDRIRVEEALRVLHAFLPVGKRPQGSSETDIDRLLHGLATFTANLARQQAVARARRFMHGAITPSNLALDVRWLDYDSVSRPPVYASCRHFTPSFWDDHLAVYPVLDSLWFHILKYIDFPDTVAFRANSLLDLYHHRFSEELRLAFLEPTGFPLELRDHLDPFALERASALGTLLVRIAKDGTTNAFPGEAEDMTGYGTYDFPRIMLALASADEARVDNELAAWMPAAALRSELIARYAEVRRDLEQVAASRGWPHGALRRLTRLTARNLCRPLALLNGPHLMRRIDEQVVPAHGDDLAQAAHALLDGLLRDVAVTFRDPSHEGVVPVASGSTWRTGYDARAETWVTERGGRVEAIPADAMPWHRLRALAAEHEEVPLSIEEATHDWYCP